MTTINRRSLMQTLGATALAMSNIDGGAKLVAEQSKSDSLPMQLYKSLSDEQRQKVCLPVDDSRRLFISNWWYVHPQHRIPDTFNSEQQELIQTIFDSLHNPEFQSAVNKQVAKDQYGQLKNAPSVGFFGTPDDDAFEFIYTGHHVTRRCSALNKPVEGFGGAPIFYGHYPETFNETASHPGNPYWYQGKLFNTFVQSLDGKQQEQGLVGANPRSEKPDVVILKKDKEIAGLSCNDLSEDQKKLLVDTMRKMLAMFRDEDVEATVQTIESRSILDQLYVSWYDGKFDIGSDRVWDTWQIEGPDMVWYFRGQPHIHSYFHVKT
ncbi:MAG: DUF3500 domain-containing protein [Pirellulaceae bacterium]